MQGLIMGPGTCIITPAATEHSKMNWTGAMDQYFVDLMLVQIRKGNKTNNIFIKQAWKDMLTSFNSKFCSQYGKSFLKRRYRKLWKYYMDIRSLLEQKGFSWDDKRQIIVADDVVWDKYIKVNPDARSYKNRTLLNYQDLNLIYGNSSNNEFWDHMQHDKNFDESLNPSKIVEEKKGHFSAGIDIQKECWTPPMDRYLTDLLLEQALRGNKIGHAFVSEAWIEMATIFNAKFGSEYDIDALKRRYKYLRRQYNGIKILIQQNGFYWDDTREMVTADDYVWDSYLKEHPEAQSFLKKSLPSYHKLCVIYGEESSNGRRRQLAHNIDLESEGLNLMNGEETQSHANCDFLREYWTTSMDRYLIDLMLEQVRKGNRFSSSFNNEAWIDIAVSFVERFGLLPDKELLKSRHKHLGKLFNDMNNLLDQRGFFWDEKHQMVSAYDDVWDAFIKEHPDAESYRTKSKPNYNDLCLIYGNSSCCGSGNQTTPSIFCNGDAAKLKNGYCKRIDWTLPMDRYFIDLMLEQVSQGNMMDQKFNKQAWENMVAKFSAEFGSQHDEDVLNSHFMNLRKRFHDIKNLLDQNGFVWDEMRQMVTADDHHWDAYIKEHPDAPWYRNRTLPSYNDLFLIFGNAYPNGREHHLSHSNDPDDFALGGSGEEDYQSPANSGPLVIEWTSQMDSYFIDIMLEQVHRGNKIGHTFSRQAWVWMTASFNEKFGFICDKYILEDHFLRLMKEYMNITNILCQNGFAWDESQQMVAADDDVWEAYIKDYPEAITYRGTNLGTYKDLCRIFGGEVRLPRSSSLGVQMMGRNSPMNMGVDGVFIDSQIPASELEISNRKRRKSTNSSISAPRKVRRPNKEMPETLAKKSDMIKKSVTYEDDGGDCSSIKSVVDALQAIPGMDDDLFLEACKLLQYDRQVSMFVQMNIRQRRKWLLRKLRP
ncbi:uncharacterized protein LOC110815515 isoform X1 [Carica papaya]|uniref:uncharacterized protein LOC110815515 isoform X1 n=4 Tax=Carica papaya TaxID=3649 RepID=UPI000B8CA1CC|nr:uncharacterized protein LOC110815515 isoform X1 [Carica papaya]